MQGACPAVIRSFSPATSFSGGAAEFGFAHVHACIAERLAFPFLCIMVVAIGINGTD